jgi:hydrogenase-4 component E
MVMIILMTFIMMLSKRISMLVNAFAAQSLFIAAMAFKEASASGTAALYAVAFLILAVKVVLVPQILKSVARKTKAGEHMGLVINPMLSVVCAVFLGYLAWIFARHVIGLASLSDAASLAISLSVMLTGLFLMVFRLKALSQVAGLLVMENGIFLAAVALCGNMPFFFEIAVFFDVFVCVLILGIFVYRINSLFTHININKLNTLKG